jgi:calcium-dependent protein kinase
MGCKVSKNV